MLAYIKIFQEWGRVVTLGANLGAPPRMILNGETEVLIPSPSDHGAWLIAIHVYAGVYGTWPLGLLT